MAMVLQETVLRCFLLKWTMAVIHLHDFRCTGSCYILCRLPRVRCTGSCLHVSLYVTRFLFFFPHTTQTKPPLISSFFLLHIFGTSTNTHFGTLSTGTFDNDTACVSAFVSKFFGVIVVESQCQERLKRSVTTETELLAFEKFLGVLVKW